MQTACCALSSPDVDTRLQQRPELAFYNTDGVRQAQTFMDKFGDKARLLGQPTGDHANLLNDFLRAFVHLQMKKVIEVRNPLLIFYLGLAPGGARAYPERLPQLAPHPPP